jgi:hypothetical protein
MKPIGYLLLTAALISSGCLPDSFLQNDKKPPRVEMKTESAPPPAVTPDSVSDNNAQEKAQALRAELEHELKRPPTTGDDPAPSR